jgi:hypothetical protein
MSAGVMRGVRGKHVQQYLGIGLAVQVAPILADQYFGQLGGVGQVAVVRQADAVRRIHVERLRLGRAVAAGGGIAYVADTLVALQRQHVLLLEHIAYQPRSLARAQAAFVRGHDTGGILAAMLQHCQRIVQTLVDGTGADDTDDAAHDWITGP